MNRYSIFEWVKRVIDSVETVQQDATAERLIRNFDKIFDDYELLSALWLYSHLHLKNWNR